MSSSPALTKPRQNTASTPSASTPQPVNPSRPQPFSTPRAARGIPSPAAMRNQPSQSPNSTARPSQSPMKAVRFSQSPASVKTNPSPTKGLRPSGHPTPGKLGSMASASSTTNTPKSGALPSRPAKSASTGQGTRGKPTLARLPSARALTVNNAATPDSKAAIFRALSALGPIEGGLPMAMALHRARGPSRVDKHGFRRVEPREKRLDRCITSLKETHSRLSPESLEILGLRYGFEALLDPLKHIRRDRTRDCTLAGDAVGIDIRFRRTRVVNVDLSMAGASEAMDRYFKAAEKVLLRNLTVPPPSVSMNHSLDKFLRSLQQLATLDKITTATGNPHLCFDAISGLYASLKKLHEYEKRLALPLIHSLAPNRAERAERAVMCTRSGRPVMNTGDEVGLKLEYWMAKRQLGTRHKAGSQDDHRIYSLSIECEQLTSSNEPIRVSKAWVSDAVEKSAKTDDDTTFGSFIDWQDPPSYKWDGSDAMELDSKKETGNDGAAQAPKVHFIARLNPPLPIPITLYNELFPTLETSIIKTEASGMIEVKAEELHKPGATPKSEISVKIEPKEKLEGVGKSDVHEKLTGTEDAGLDPAHSFDGLYHHLAAGKAYAAADLKKDTIDVEAKKHVSWSQKGDKMAVEEHMNTMHPKTIVLSRFLKEIPFSHPKELVKILPVLRQYAVMHSLIQQSFSDSTAIIHENNDQSNNGDSGNESQLQSARYRKVNITVDAANPRMSVIFTPELPQLGEPRKAKERLRLNAVIPDMLTAAANTAAAATESASREKTHQIVVEVARNGRIVILAQDVLRPSSAAKLTTTTGDGDGDVMMPLAADGAGDDDADPREESTTVEDMTRGLDLLGDINVWILWLARRHE